MRRSTNLWSGFIYRGNGRCRLCYADNIDFRRGLVGSDDDMVTDDDDSFETNLNTTFQKREKIDPDARAGVNGLTTAFSSDTKFLDVLIAIELNVADYIQRRLVNGLGTIHGHCMEGLWPRTDVLMTPKESVNFTLQEFCQQGSADENDDEPDGAGSSIQNNQAEQEFVFKRFVPTFVDELTRGMGNMRSMGRMGRMRGRMRTPPPRPDENSFSYNGFFRNITLDE